MKIAVHLPNWIGDAVMATPALRALRTRFAQAEIVAVLRPSIADVLAGLALVDRVLPHDPRGNDRDRRGLRILRSLRKERFDLAVLFANSLRSAALAWLAGAKRRVGFARDGRSWLLTDALIPKSRTTPNPVLDEYLRLAAHLGCDTTKRATEAAVLPEDQLALDRFWSRQTPRCRAGGYICLNPGGAFGSSKHWPAEHFAGLARRIVDEVGQTVVVLCGPAERDVARQIVLLANRRRVISLAEEPLSIGLTKGAIRESRLLVTTDSGPRHFAQPFGVPVVALFGPTHQAWSDTGDPRAIHLQLVLDCGPCQQRACPVEHHRCMRDLHVDCVFDAVRIQLKRHTPLAA